MLGEQFSQEQIPGVNWDKVELEGRKAAVQTAFGQSPYAPIPGFAGLHSGFGRIAEAEGPNRGRKFRAPTKEVADAIVGTTVPITPELRYARPVIRSEEAPMGQGGSYESTKREIAYSRREGAADRRGILAHEIGHAMQDTEGRARLVDLDKSYRSSMAGTMRMEIPESQRNHPNAPKAQQIIDQAKESIMRKSRRYQLPVGLGELEAVPTFEAGLVVSEANAEGFREHHTAKDIAAGKSTEKWYQPEQFGNFGPHGPELFSMVKEQTKRTGKIITNSELKPIIGLTGVLKSDLKPEGTRDFRGDMMAAQRMLYHHFSEPDPVTGMKPYEGEYRQRRKAIEGEYVQGSMFKDIVPETDQFGDAPTGIPARSPRGEALAAGHPTEKKYTETVDWRVMQQERLKDRRTRSRWNREGNDRTVSKHHSALQKHVAEVQQRRARQAEAGQRASTGELHPAVNEWLGKLVYQKKKDYAEAYARHRAGMGEAPKIPTGLKEEHAEKARQAVDKLWQKHGL